MGDGTEGIEDQGKSSVVGQKRSGMDNVGVLMRPRVAHTDWHCMHCPATNVSQGTSQTVQCEQTQVNILSPTPPPTAEEAKTPLCQGPDDASADAEVKVNKKLDVW